MSPADHAAELPRYRDWAPTANDTRGLACEHRQDWVVHPCSQTRDSDALARSNYRVALEILGGESDTVETHRFGHWACGWLEIILVHPSRAEDVAKTACALADYPVLSDEDFSELEWEEKTMNLPSAEDVAKDLEYEQAECAEGDLDVRLCYDTCCAKVVSGDVSYDTRHYPHCGSAVISADMTQAELLAVAEDLLSQVVDSLGSE